MKKNKNKENSPLIITHRITTSKHTNILKKEQLKDHFDNVKTFKNHLSEAIWNEIKHYGLITAKKQCVHKDFIKHYHNDYLSTWETQKIISNILDHYTTRIENTLENKSFKIQDKMIVSHYQKDTKKNKKGDVKCFELSFKKGTYTNLLNYLKYHGVTGLDNYAIPYEKKGDNKTTFPHCDIQKYRLCQAFETLKKHELHYHHFKKVLSFTYEKILKKKTIEYSSGSYIKTAVFNKNANVPDPENKEKKLFQPTKHSYVFQDSTNTQFQWFYHFKTNVFEMDIPLSYHSKYHNTMKQYDLNKEHYVSLDNRGNISIGLVTTRQKPTFKPFQKACGIDLNIRDNFCIIHDGKKFWNFDYQRQHLNKMIETLNSIDTRDKVNGKTAPLSETERKLLTALLNKNVSMIKKIIATILKKLDKKGITDVAMEDLTLFETKSSYIRNSELGEKYSRLVRMLRLSQVKHWFKRNAENYGIRVHFIQAAYSSQECSKCHTIDKNQRQGDSYSCECGYSTHSDYNASKNIYNRMKEDVLLKKLHNKDDNGCYVSKPIKHSKIKDVIIHHYQNKV